MGSKFKGQSHEVNVTLSISLGIYTVSQKTWHSTFIHHKFDKC